STWRPARDRFWKNYRQFVVRHAIVEIVFGNAHLLSGWWNRLHARHRPGPAMGAALVPLDRVIALAAILDPVIGIVPVRKAGIERRKHLQSLLFVQNSRGRDELEIVRRRSRDLLNVVRFQSLDI